MPIFACSFTGHRKIEPRHTKKLTELLARGIKYVYDNGCRNFYLGGAVGFDTLAAQQVLLFRMTHPDVTFNLVLPFRGQSDRWGPEQRDMYDYLLSQADTIEYISDDYTGACMRQRNARLVELAEALIAYVGHDKSGAAQTKRMAERAGKAVYNLYLSAES